MTCRKGEQNEMKRVIAFLAALAMTAAVGCGEVEKDEPSAKMGIETSASEKTSEVAEDGGESASEGMVNDSNCIIDADYQDDDNDEYDKAALYKMMELAVKQYNAIIDRDKQAYFDTVNIKGVLTDKGIRRLYGALADMYDEDEVSNCELEIYYNAVEALGDLDRTEIDDIEHLLDEESITEEEAVDKCDEIIRGVAEGITPEDVPAIYDKYSPFSILFGEDAPEDLPEGFADDPSAFKIVPDDSTIFGIELDEYAGNEYGSFAELDLIVAQGDWEYVLDECLVWINGDQTSVYIGNIHIDENEVKGMTIDEIREEVSSDDNINAANLRAKVAYNAVAEYVADEMVKGRSLEEIIDDDDFLLAADKGIQLERDNTQTTLLGRGDMVLSELYDYGELPAGRVFVGFYEENGKKTFFTQFNGDSAFIGQYPKPPTKDNWDMVALGEFFQGGYFGDD